MKADVQWAPPSSCQLRRSQHVPFVLSCHFERSERSAQCFAGESCQNNAPNVASRKESSLRDFVSFVVSGVYNPFKLHHTNERKLQRYGPIVKETIMGRTYLLVFDPEDIARIFKCESKYPHRETLLSLKEYRVRKHSTTCDPNAGLIVTYV